MHLLVAYVHAYRRANLAQLLLATSVNMDKTAKLRA